MQPEPIILHQGIAMKSPPEMFFLRLNMWKERFFILWKNSEFECNLVYYATDGTRKRKGVIPIREIKDIMKGPSCDAANIAPILMLHLCDPDNVLLVMTKCRKYYLINNDQEEIEAWYQHLKMARLWEHHPQEPSLSTPVPETNQNEARNPPARCPNLCDLWAPLHKQSIPRGHTVKQERPCTYPSAQRKTGHRNNRSNTNPGNLGRPMYGPLLPMLSNAFQSSGKEAVGAAQSDSDSDTSESDPQENSEPDSDQEQGKPIRGASMKKNTFQKKKVIVSTEELKKHFDVGECLYVRKWNPTSDAGDFNQGDLIYSINGFRLNSRQMLFNLLRCCTEEEVTLTVLRSRMAPFFHTMGCSCTPDPNAELFH
ncbi:uncharacterized protein LOC100496133 isoform X2 [Xenopus tropicalis]|uniref:Uncharacterized protein LOC100496133 isoform X2 n=1 Tax=Xenopus tropicalis TaxID=8364 RepID=A0A8J1JYZ0_XENTR|nr:uncharacterized protein LOC100496133 isoform X2 [Xenopus tropicalis]